MMPWSFSLSMWSRGHDFSRQLDPAHAACWTHSCLSERKWLERKKRLLHSIPGRGEEEGSKKEKRKKKILLLDEKINKPRTRMTKMSQCRNIDSTSWIICGMCGASQNTWSPFHCERLLWGVADDGFSCGIEFLCVLRRESWRRQRGGSDSLAVQGSCLFLASSLHFMGPVWCVRRQKQQSCQVALQDPTKLSLSSTFPSAMKKRYEQMDKFTCSIPLWWIWQALLPLYVCFPCFNFFFFPR